MMLALIMFVLDMTLNQTFNEKDYFFLCLFFLSLFLRLCVDILCLLCFFPFGIIVLSLKS